MEFRAKTTQSKLRTSKPKASLRIVLSLKKRQPRKETVAQAFKRTLREAQIERTWFNNAPMFSTRQIQTAIQQGELVPVETIPGLVRIVSAEKGKLSGVQYSYLTPECKKLFLSIATAFGKQRDTKKLEKHFLNVTSMTRDRERQARLRRQGYPAAEQSTHGLGEAFDINVTWLKSNAPSHFKILEGILNQLRAKGAINLIDETTINGALHVARNPNYKSR